MYVDVSVCVMLLLNEYIMYPSLDRVVDCVKPHLRLLSGELQEVSLRFWWDFLPVDLAWDHLAELRGDDRRLADLDPDDARVLDLHVVLRLEVRLFREPSDQDGGTGHE